MLRESNSNPVPRSSIRVPQVTRSGEPPWSTAGEMDPGRRPPCAPVSCVFLPPFHHSVSPLIEFGQYSFRDHVQSSELPVYVSILQFANVGPGELRFRSTSGNVGKSIVSPGIQEGLAFDPDPRRCLVLQ